MIFNHIKKNKIYRSQILTEEIANSFSHCIGVFLSLFSFIILLIFANFNNNLLQFVSFMIYTFALFSLYLSSTLYHGFIDKNIKEFFHRLDHAAIYLLIAGTYTPITLIAMNGFSGFVLFIIIWLFAICGIILKFILSHKIKDRSALLYIIMGWCILIDGKQIIDEVPAGMLVWIFIGGLLYTFGIIFYKWNKLLFHHAIWHLFVLSASVCHFLGIVLYLV